MVRRIGSLNTGPAIALLVRALGASNNADEQLVILRGIDRALAGRRRVSPPAEWPAVFGKIAGNGDERLRSEATALGVKFGDAKAMSALA